MSKRRRPSREDYTVGWVCALPVELAAAREMLDEEHEALGHDANDNNIYTLGRVSEHNVVIACLPVGKTGTNSAAAVAVEMNSVFPSIRFGLMVGIGGGVPSVEADIRLGDVVVSSPHKQHGGVVQYDLGKAAPSGFKQMGFINSPPRILLNAVSNIQANQWVRKSRLVEYLSKLTDLPAFARENAGPDVLFTAEYDHEGGATCEQCSKEKVIERQSRGQEIMVHYGTIASGNQVMRDGATRDGISLRLGGVLCFEMEAAGLMDSFPCLVIRGICDYADSHKNKRWQPYAAGTAAAYAKEVLSVIPAAEVTKSRTVDDITQKNALDTILNRLPYAVEAPFNSYQRQQEPTCLPDTRVDLLQEIYDWADRQDEHFIFWLNGLAGTGKSTIARTVARRCFEQDRLGASFFFSRGDGDVGHARQFFTTIALQLAKKSSLLHRYICEAVTKHSDVVSQSLPDQWRQLVLRPLSKFRDSSCPSYILVIDALDECDDDNNIRMILHLLAEARSLKTVQLRVFMTSRPEIPIRHGIYELPKAEHQDFILHNIAPAIVDQDISKFLGYNLKIIRRECYLTSNWPCEQDIGRLIQNANGLFIWMATACRFVREGKRFAKKRLTLILEGDSSTVTEPEKHLNEIYLTVLEHSIRPNYTDEEKEEFCSTLRHILGSIVVLLSPLSAYSLSRLLDVTKQDVDQALDDLHAILDIPEDHTRPLSLHHPSFRDFLLDKDRCTDSRFWADEKKTNGSLANSCIELMSKKLRSDICSLRSPGTPAAEAQWDAMNQCLPKEVQYACLYWVQHIQKSETQLQDNGQVHVFLKEHLLHWLEALSLMGKIPEGVLAISSLESYIQTSTSPNLYAFIHDAKRFALRHRSVIEYTPLQVYSSALIFTPESSIIRRQFKEQLPSWIGRLPKTQLDWSATLQTLEGHTSFVKSVTFSHDGKLLASASWDGTVRLWDPATGSALQTLEDHTLVSSVAFSHDSKLLASASGDNTVRLWDPVTGAALQTLKGHTHPVNSVAFSHDSKLLASASGSNTVTPWSSVMGVALQTLEGHTSANSVVFSYDGKLLAPASLDYIVRLWDPATGAALQTLEGHTDRVNSVAFSHDGKLLASASWDNTVRLWEPATGAALQTLKGHTFYVESVAFSHDGKLLASASNDKTVRLWDPATGAALQTLEGHTQSVDSVAFSHDGKLLASASWDKTVRLWDPATGSALQTLEGHIHPADSVAFSHDGKLLASASCDDTVRLWDPAMGAALQTLEGHTQPVNSVAFSYDGKLLASASWDNTVKLWDPTTGAALQTLKGHTSSVVSVAFSHDGKLLASASGDNTVRLWDPITGLVLQTLEDHISSVNSVAFSHDGKLLASASWDRTVRLWDPATGAALQTLEGHTHPVNSVAFSHDGKLLASASEDKTVSLWDLATGSALQTLKGHTHPVNSVAFSHDGKLLASASEDNIVRLWDLATGAALQTLEVDVSLKSISFSRDAQYLKTNRGLLSLQSSSNLSSPQVPSLYQILVKGDWITRDGENLLRLPSDYKAECSALHDNILVIGHTSGEVTFIEFRS